jgi:hypothetical protein
MAQDVIAAVDAIGDDLICSKQCEPNQGQEKNWAGPEDGDVTD